MTGEELIRQYYKSYYCDELGLRDWKQRVEARVHEEEHFALPVISTLEQVLNYIFSGKKVLVVGAGTGAEFVALYKKGAEVYGLEPNNNAVDILKTKCEKHGIDFSRVVRGTVEKLPYPDESFDFVYCYTVLEHVQDVNKALLEMVRVTSVGGKIFIATGNYRIPYEPHYKIFMPTFLPKIFIKWYLWLRRRPTAFIDTVNFILCNKLLDIIRRMPVITLQILHDFPEGFARKSNFFYLFIRYLGLEKNLWFILVKRANKR
jgi:2-polyprenyl-3-methyl-5-hydroxy-6-metoxy-1,4-benzoquinol methylase